MRWGKVAETRRVYKGGAEEEFCGAEERDHHACVCVCVGGALGMLKQTSRLPLVSVDTEQLLHTTPCKICVCALHLLVDTYFCPGPTCSGSGGLLLTTSLE